MEIRKLTMLSMLLGLSVVFNLIENSIPFIGGMFLGVKLGIANIIVIVVIYMYTFKDAMYISISRVFLVSLIGTGLFGPTFFFSLSGATLSTILMYVVKKYTNLSVIGVSVVGAISHSIGQILMAIVILKTVSVIFYLPYVLILAIPTGIIVGMSAKNVLKFYNVGA